jgi:hypothetical protein
MRKLGAPLDLQVGQAGQVLQARCLQAAAIGDADGPKLFAALQLNSLQLV